MSVTDSIAYIARLRFHVLSHLLTQLAPRLPCGHRVWYTDSTQSWSATAFISRKGFRCRAFSGSTALRSNVRLPWRRRAGSIGSAVPAAMAMSMGSSTAGSSKEAVSRQELTGSSHFGTGALHRAKPAVPRVSVI